jgi:hypothetical protein
MRILSIGFPIPGPNIENFRFLAAPAWFDYDAVIADPEAIGRELNEAKAQEAVRAIANRHCEAERLLSHGGMIVCIARPPANGPANYAWLPAPPGITLDEPLLRAATGTAITGLDIDHPFARAVQRIAKQLSYQSYFDESAQGFAEHGTVLARSAGAAAVSVELRMGPGRIVFLPGPGRQLTAEERYHLSAELREAIRNTLRPPSGSGPPAWLEQYARSAIPSPVTPDASASDSDGCLALLWQEGGEGFEAAVRAAFTLLGFRVQPSDLEQPAMVYLRDQASGERSALLEVSASEEAVGLDGHYRLRRRLEEAIEKGAPRRGVLVINGYRRTPPDERPPQYTEGLLHLAELMRYCLVTGEQLFHAVRAALAGDSTTVRAFCERVLTAEGALKQD